MNLFTVIRRSTRYYWRSNVAVVLGVTVAVAVLIGSLVVGDSVRGTLRTLALERLGRTDYALTTGPFVREGLAADLLAQPEVAGKFELATPAILLEGTASLAREGTEDTGGRSRAAPIVPRVNVIGVREEFARLGAQELSGLKDDRVVLNQRLADDLGAAKGDPILFRVGRRASAPTDSLFGRRKRRDTERDIEATVGDVIPTRGLGTFSLRTDQARPRNLYVSLPWLQTELDRVRQSSVALLAATVERDASKATVSGVSVFAVREDFTLVGHGEEARPLKRRRVLLNAALAKDLGAAKGDALTLRIVPLGRSKPAARGERAGAAATLSVVVQAILPASPSTAGSLPSDPSQGRNLYVLRSWLQWKLKRAPQFQRPEANAILAAAMPVAGDAATQADTLASALAAAATLEDYGVRIVPNPRRGTLSLESERLVLPWSVVAAARRAAAEGGMGCGATSIYLANSLQVAGNEDRDRRVAYSVVAGLDPHLPAPLGPLPMAEGEAPRPLASDDILLTEPTARRLGARIGQSIEMTYYISGEHGALHTGTLAFTLRCIVALAGPALDPGLVPDFEGITDARSMSDWNPPFRIDREAIPLWDETYWERYRTTPRAYVSLDTARSLWRPGERFPAADSDAPGGDGWVTSVRVAPKAGAGLAESAARFEHLLLRRLVPAEHGLAFRPVKAEALDAARGSTDFGVLFLSMSMFLVVASAALVGLLLRLSIERRAGQFGILLATGFTPGTAARMLVGEGLVLALVGVVVGTPLGLAYAWGIIYGLREWWQGAAGDFAFALHVEPATLAMGAAAGFAVAAVALWWSARMLRRTRALTLLAGWRAVAAQPRRATRRRAFRVGASAFAVAGVLLILSGGLGVISATLAFFLIGASLLVGSLALVCGALQRPEAMGAGSGAMSLWRLAARGASRHWLRSVLTVGLLACASFLIVVVAANRKDPGRLDTAERASGAGGFNLLAQSAVPIHHDLNTPEGRKALDLNPRESEALAEAVIVSLYSSSGDDVSCLNIQRPAAARVLGVPPEMIERGGFAFASHLPLETPEGEDPNPWRLLEEAPTSDEPGAEAIPAFADTASAQWILKVGLGEELTVPSRQGEPVRLRLVGLLAGSVFQGQVLVSAGRFRQHFDADAGYRYFLIRTPPEREGDVLAALRGALSEPASEGGGDLGSRLGLDVSRTADVLANYARVQNTYLSTFETLGGLGLLLGTFGIVAVLLRSIVERRAELAMMLALGFRKRGLFGTILVENALLLLLGVAIGAASALVAVAPHLASALADVRWPSLAATLLACVAVGLSACAAATLAATRGSLLSALRAE